MGETVELKRTGVLDAHVAALTPDQGSMRQIKLFGEISKVSANGPVYW
jgi:hypothetical protein